MLKFQFVISNYEIVQNYDELCVIKLLRDSPLLRNHKLTKLNRKNEKSYDTCSFKKRTAPLCSIAVNVPKFFEAEVAWHDDISQLQVQASNLLS